MQSRVFGKFTTQLGLLKAIPCHQGHLNGRIESVWSLACRVVALHVVHAACLIKGG